MSGNAFAVITVVMETVMTANAYHGAKFILSVTLVDKPVTLMNSHAKSMVMIKKPKAVMMREPMT